jgi:hypothetical protein
MVATDRYASMAETPAANLERVSHVGQVEIRMLFEVLDQILGDVPQRSVGLSGENQ